MNELWMSIAPLWETSGAGYDSISMYSHLLMITLGIMVNWSKHESHVGHARLHAHTDKPSACSSQRAANAHAAYLRGSCILLQLKAKALTLVDKTWVEISGVKQRWGLVNPNVNINMTHFTRYDPYVDMYNLHHWNTPRPPHSSPACGQAIQFSQLLPGDLHLTRFESIVISWPDIGPTSITACHKPITVTRCDNCLSIRASSLTCQPN